MSFQSSKWLLFALVLKIGLPVGAASAAPAQPAFIQTMETADAPAGFIEMCERDQVLCRAGLPERETSFTSVISGTPSGCETSIFSAAAPEPGGWMPPVGLAVSFWTDAPIARHNCGGDAVRPQSMAAVTQPAGPPIGLPVTLSTGSGTASIEGQSRFFRHADFRPAPPLPTAGGNNDRRLIKMINERVNHQVVQVSDLASRGVEEEWDRPGERGHPPGDCEDIAIEKRMRLLEAGFPADKMFYAVVFKSNFGLHTILIARLADGDYALDSANPHVMRWSATRYVWLRAQSTADPMVWTRIGRPGALQMANVATPPAPTS